MKNNYKKDGDVNLLNHANVLYQCVLSDSSCKIHRAIRWKEIKLQIKKLIDDGKL